MLRNSVAICVHPKYYKLIVYFNYWTNRLIISYYFVKTLSWIAANHRINCPVLLYENKTNLKSTNWMETIGWRRDWMQWLILHHYSHSLGTILASNQLIQPSPTYKLCIAVRCQVMGVSSLVYIRLGMLVILCILNVAVSIYKLGATVDPRSLVTLSICRLECHHFNKSSPNTLAVW